MLCIYICPLLLNLPPSPGHPPGLSQNTGFVLPLSYSNFPLAICFTYGNVYVSGPPSQIRPTPFFHCCVHKPVLYIWVSIPAPYLFFLSVLDLYMPTGSKNLYFVKKISQNYITTDCLCTNKLTLA